MGEDLQSRRACCELHKMLFSGLDVMMLDPTALSARLFVWLVAALSITMTWELSPLPAFRFSRPKDKGVTIYLLLVSIWFYLQLPPMILAPVFFADPAGAVVGRACTRHFPRYNPAWYGQKSVCGSLAVFLLTFCTISFPCDLIERIAIANAATIAEAFGGDYDNLALATTVLIGWRITNEFELTSIQEDL